MATQLVTIFWRDIPSQVNAQEGRKRHQIQLGDLFQHAIDRAAMVAGLDGSDDYLNEWRRETRPCTDDLEAEALAEVAKIEAAFSRETLAAYATNGGLKP
jgi:hypothetical protein